MFSEISYLCFLKFLKRKFNLSATESTVKGITYSQLAFSTVTLNIFNWGRGP